MKLIFFLVLFIIPLVAMPHPSAFSQTPEFEPIITVDKFHTTTQIGELQFQRDSHFEYLEDFNGNYIPYRLIDNDDWVQVEFAGGKIVFDKVNGAVTIFEVDENFIDIPIINSDSYQVRVAELGTDVWTFLDVNNSPVTTTIVEDGDLITVTFTRTSDEGIFNLEYLVRSGIKTTAKFTNNIYDNHKFAFTETLNLSTNFVTLNDQEVDLNDYVGQTFDRDTLIPDLDFALEMEGLLYNSGLGFDNLWSVGIFDNNRIAIDYANNGLGIDEVQTAIGETIELDPSVSLTVYQLNGVSNVAGTWLQKGAYNGGTASFGSCASNYAISSGGTLIGIGNGYCGRNIFPFDITSIPDNVTIDDVKLKSTKYYQYYHGDVSCKFMSVESNTLGSGASASGLWTDSADGTAFLHDTGSSHTATSGNACQYQTGYGYGNRWAYDVIWDLGTNADSDLQAELAVDNEWAVGVFSPEAEAHGAYASNTGHMNGWYENGYPMSLTVTYTAPPPPNVPTSFTIDTQDVANEFTLRWVAPASGTTPDGYKIGRSVDGGTFNDSYVADTGSTAITYDNTGLSPDTSYAYRVWSLDGAVASTTYASVAGTTTWDLPNQVGTVTGTSGTSPALSWSAPSSDGAITNYKIYRGGVLHDTISASPTTYSDSTSVVSGSTYAYTVSAVSAVGEGAQSASVNVVAGVPPNPPTGISASITNTATAPLDVTVSFSPSATTGTGTVTGFQLLRDGVAVATDGLVTSLDDTAPSGGTTYAYTVKALGTHGNSVASASSSVTTPNTPAQVTGLTVTPVSTSRIDLSWNTPSDNNSLISGYKVQISSNGGSSYTDVLTGNVNTVYQALSLSTNSQYHFKVSAINGVGTGTASAVSNTYTMTPTPATLTATSVSEVQINLAWGVSTGATGYKIESESPSGNGFTTHTANTGNTDLTKPITGLTTATQYNFRVSGINAGGASVASPEASTFTFGILTAPTLDTITRLSPTSLKLDFTAGTGLPVATGYKIERQTGSGWIELIANTGNTDVTYTDSVLSSDQTASYRLYAINSIGTSSVSNERTSDVVASSSGGGGGGSSSKAVSSQTGSTGLIDLTFIDQIHRVVLGQFLSKSINVAWDSSDNLEVKSIIVGDSPFRIVFQDVPFVLIGDPSGISNGKINYSVQIPSELCTQQGQLNCVEQKQYEVPVEIQSVHKGSTLTKSSVIKIDLAGGSDIPLVFVLLAIGAVPLAFIIRKVGSGKSRRKASGSSHKSSKNGSNSKKVSL